jgi:hypothetical protein
LASLFFLFFLQVVCHNPSRPHQLSPLFRLIIRSPNISSLSPCFLCCFLSALRSPGRSPVSVCLPSVIVFVVRKFFILTSFLEMSAFLTTGLLRRFLACGLAFS